LVDGCFYLRRRFLCCCLPRHRNLLRRVQTEDSFLWSYIFVLLFFMKKPGHRAVEKSMLNQHWVLIVPFLWINVPDSPKGNISIVLCLRLVNLKSKLLMLYYVIWIVKFMITWMNKYVWVHDICGMTWKVITFGLTMLEYFVAYIFQQNDC